MTRAEHLLWARRRALKYVDSGKPHLAIASMISDLRKHESLQVSANLGAVIAPYRGSVDQVRHWVRGFN